MRIISEPCSIAQKSGQTAKARLTGERNMQATSTTYALRLTGRFRRTEMWRPASFCCRYDSTPEMQLFTALGVALYSIGPGPESGAAWTRVIEIAESLKDTDYQLRAHWGLWTVCVTGGKHRNGLALAEKLVILAGNRRDPEGLLVGERLVGTSRHFLGEQAVARQHLERMINRAPLGNPADVLRFQFDQSVVARAFLGKVLWLTGFPDAAVNASIEA
jgi:hypothetical protein